MKTNYFRGLMAVLATSGMTFSGATTFAQVTAITDTAQPPAVQLGYGASQILRLAQAKVGDDTIMAYIQNSGNSYALSADQIIYLRQQGVSSGVIATMLNQPRTGVAAAPPPTYASDTTSYTATAAPAYTASAAPAYTATAAPTVTYVQTAPATTYYYPPAYYPYYYPSYYGCYPGLSLSFGWGGCYGGGGYYGGCGYGSGYYGSGYHGGGYYGGGYHGGGYYAGYHGGGYSGGGYHGGSYGGGGYHGGGHH
jgi:hypothetical protein